MADGIQIDTEQVGAFGKDMSRQSTNGFAHAATRGANLHQHGVVFGAALTSPVFDEAKRRYAEALANTEANLRTYQRAAKVLAEAADQIAKEFARADQSAQEAQRRVQDIISATIVKTQVPEVGQP